MHFTEAPLRLPAKVQQFSTSITLYLPILCYCVRDAGQCLLEENAKH